MTGNITLALRSAQSGMAANQIALDVAANNITNVNSPDYSRKIANFEQRSVNGAGAGVQISKIIRNVDEGLLRSLRTQYSELQEVDIQKTYFQRMQDLFGRPEDNSSISHIVADFTKSIESLALSPEKIVDQNEVVRWAKEAALKLNQLDKTIQVLRLEADVAITDETTRLNEIANRIQELNVQIVRNEAYNLDVTDLEDKRDADLNALSKIINIQYFKRENGEVVVYSGAGNVLVDSVPITVSHQAAGNMNSMFTYDSGDFDGIWIGSTQNSTNDITNRLGAGTLKGLVDIRDNTLGGLQSQIDALAAQLRDVINQEHNRGISFPGAQTMSGTRGFADPSLQTITLDAQSGSDDVSIVLFDATGNQQVATTLETIMTSAEYGSGAQAADGPWTIEEVAQTIEGWLKNNGATGAVAAFDDAGKFNIQLNEPSLNIGFRDQATSLSTSAHQDAAIGFDANGDGSIDETINGFSNFFGLNDFFIDDLPRNLLDSDSMATSYTSPVTAQTLSFRDSTGNIVNSPATTVTIPAGSSLETIAALINTNVSDVSASVVSDGPYSRLRILHNGNENLVVTQDVAGGDTLLTDIGLKRSALQTASVLDVRSDLQDLPSNIAIGTIQWDANLGGGSGEFYTSVADGSNMNALASRLSQATSFGATGGLSASSVTFENYSASILATNASMASTNEMRLEYQQSLTTSIEHKSNSVRGVNIDEEMSQLLIFEQAYIASTRVISVIQKMLDALEAVIR